MKGFLSTVQLNLRHTIWSNREALRHRPLRWENDICFGATMHEKKEKKCRNPLGGCGEGAASTYVFFFTTDREHDSGRCAFCDRTLPQEIRPSAGHVGSGVSSPHEEAVGRAD